MLGSIWPDQSSPTLGVRARRAIRSLDYQSILSSRADARAK
ncbi:Uncharacterised protein [Mycobacterium tuberculosis]|uniref:Uncharacterized protein n=1 Tax=Mycobacterium tuberculosis (strain CDC 1551 / Oshkosh) TaxID=83331 RepID=Q8VIZ4_MYCTO|nr:hypothetical protein MT3580.2 [Mycobacterium tuberculosis CDC1551]COW38084.1 Uncharacterised protein [Mycobacterium tuberculosis]COX04224.1 Uncharacterised protein [Mycobacterium tuberculosis]COY25130.1 Uncharacterised protein [Mycobacterium tuberculosis]